MCGFIYSTPAAYLLSYLKIRHWCFLLLQSLSSLSSKRTRRLKIICQQPTIFNSTILVRIFHIFSIENWDASLFIQGKGEKTFISLWQTALLITKNKDSTFMAVTLGTIVLGTVLWCLFAVPFYIQVFAFTPQYVVLASVKWFQYLNSSS
jgi:hypothetical protein